MKHVLKKSKIRNPESEIRNKIKVGRRELLASESGTEIKKWGGKIPVCVVFPNTYYIGMSNLAVHMLYKTLNDMPDVVCERCFFEECGECISIESGRNLSSFECIFFTVSYELDYVNIVKILSLSSVALHAKERKNGEPIVVAGGICAIANPEPIHSFFDLFLMGDIEPTIPDFMEKYRETRGKARDEVVDGLSRFDWVYNPARLEVSYGESGTVESFTPGDFIVKVKRYTGKTLGTSAIITDRTEFARMFLVEGTRGCPSKCPFCLLGNVYRFICDRILPLKTDIEDIGIIGGGVSFHPHITEIVQELKGKGKRIHFPSLRLDEIPLSIVELMQDEVKTLTFGIEAGAERLRKVMGKPLKDVEIYEKLNAILGIKPFNLKLYFMIGLPGEKMEDIEAIVELVKHMKHVMVKQGAKRGFVGSITVHTSPFVPKPSTPFQWLPMDDMTTLKNKINLLKKGMANVDNTYFTHESVKYSFIQGVLARGDRRVSDIIMRFAEGDSLNRVLRESPINLNFYALREREEDELFPWDFIGSKTTKRQL